MFEMKMDWGEKILIFAVLMILLVMDKVMKLAIKIGP